MWLDVIFQFDIVRCAGESAERAVEQILVLLWECEQLLLLTSREMICALCDFIQISFGMFCI